MTRVAFIIGEIRFLTNLREALRLQPDITCALAALQVEEFWRLLPKRSTLDVVFVDAALPAQEGINAIPALRKRFPDAEIVLLAETENAQLLLRAINAGATGYINKDFPPVYLPQMIKTLLNGGALISPKVARALVEYFKPSAATADLLNLKEEQLLRLFYEGKTYEETAALMGMTIDGVKYHVKNIYRKLNVNNKVDALRLYREGTNGLVENNASTG